MARAGHGVDMSKVAGRLKTGKKAAGAGSVDLAPLGEFVGYALRRAQIAVFDEFIREFAALDLRPAPFSVLAVIARNPGLNQSEVALALGIQRANFVVLIGRLEQRGVVERRPVDKRSYALHLTNEGEKLLAAAMDLQDRLEARVEARLGAGGKARLMELLSRLR